MKVSSMQLHIESSFQGYPTCLSFLHFRFQMAGGDGSLFSNHHKNCKCCPMSLFIEGWQWMLTLLLKCQKCKSKTLWIYNYQISLSSPHPFSIPIAVSIFLLWISSFKSSKYLVITFCISICHHKWRWHRQRHLQNTLVHPGAFEWDRIACGWC